MRRLTPELLFVSMLGLVIGLLAWPVFVAVASGLALMVGEAWQIDAWSLEPKRRLLSMFFDGWRQSATIAAGAGVLAMLDYVLLARYRLLSIVAGVLLPFTGAALAMALYPDPMPALPVLAGAGLVLALVYRLLDAIRRWSLRE